MDGLTHGQERPRLRNATTEAVSGFLIHHQNHDSSSKQSASEKKKRKYYTSGMLAYPPLIMMQFLWQAMGIETAKEFSFSGPTSLARFVRLNPCQCTGGKVFRHIERTFYSHFHGYSLWLEQATALSQTPPLLEIRGAFSPCIPVELMGRLLLFVQRRRWQLSLTDKGNLWKSWDGIGHITCHIDILQIMWEPRPTHVSCLSHDSLNSPWLHLRGWAKSGFGKRQAYQSDRQALSLLAGEI